MVDIKRIAFCIGVIWVMCQMSLLSLWAGEFEYGQMEKSFKNFITCELTRTNAKNPFKGKPFKITMIDMFDVTDESELTIVSGAVECFVGNSHKTLYAAVGLKKIVGKKTIAYYVIKDKDFSILATQLMKYPYKERCKWSEYWIDID